MHVRIHTLRKSVVACIRLSPKFEMIKKRQINGKNTISLGSLTNLKLHEFGYLSRKFMSKFIIPLLLFVHILLFNKCRSV